MWLEVWICVQRPLFRVIWSPGWVLFMLLGFCGQHFPLQNNWKRKKARTLAFLKQTFTPHVKDGKGLQLQSTHVKLQQWLQPNFVVGPKILRLKQNKSKLSLFVCCPIQVALSGLALNWMHWMRDKFWSKGKTPFRLKLGGLEKPLECPVFLFFVPSKLMRGLWPTT